MYGWYCQPPRKAKEASKGPSPSPGEGRLTRRLRWLTPPGWPGEGPRLGGPRPAQRGEGYPRAGEGCSSRQQGFPRPPGEGAPLDPARTTADVGGRVARTGRGPPSPTPMRVIPADGQVGGSARSGEGRPPQGRGEVPIA
ncbi:hypothetical protein NL676_021443 [Syzygium grande]|nr:hypothetical protein NL676_021443 [Syzygium grande]